MAEDADARRRAFVARAPQLRVALVSELSACVARAPTLTPDESAVLRHVLAFAGYAETGVLRIPGLAPLWGEAVSYVPPVRLPPENVRAAARLLLRRGVLRPEGDELALDAGVLRALAAPAKPKARSAAPRRRRARRR